MPEDHKSASDRLFGDRQVHSEDDPCASGKGDCAEVKQNASDFIDEDCDPGVVKRMRHHLGLCTNCDSWLRSLAVTVGLVRELPQESPPPALLSKIRGLTRR